MAEATVGGVWSEAAMGLPAEAAMGLPARSWTAPCSMSSSREVPRPATDCFCASVSWMAMLVELVAVFRVAPSKATPWLPLVMVSLAVSTPEAYTGSSKVTASTPVSMWIVPETNSGPSVSSVVVVRLSNGISWKETGLPAVSYTEAG